MRRADEQKCPVHGSFLRLEGRRIDPGGLIVQEPVSVSSWGCPEPDCNFEVHFCPVCKELLEHTGSVGPGGAYVPGQPLKGTGQVHHFKCPKCERTFMVSGGHKLLETGDAPKAKV
jgi:hypothetical protein